QQPENRQGGADLATSGNGVQAFRHSQAAHKRAARRGQLVDFDLSAYSLFCGLMEHDSLDKAPDAFRTISEVAEELDVPQHVLRFWESRFREIRPMKRGGGRRYYRRDDLDLLRGIRHLLYGEGYTIRGVQRLLREQGVRFVQNVWHPDAAQPPRQGEAEENGEAETALAAGAGVLSLPGARDTLGSKG